MIRVEQKKTKKDITRQNCSKKGKKEMMDETKKLVQTSKNGHSQRLVEQLTEEALALDGGEKKPTKKNKALFLSKKDEIKEAMDAGWHMKNIWGLLVKQQAFVGGYDCFIRYVHRYIKNVEPNLTDGDVSSMQATATKLRHRTTSGTTRSDGFNFNVYDGSNDENLM